MKLVDMKLNYIGISLVWLLLAACSPDELQQPGSNESNNVIGFGAYAGVQTRGTETKLAALKASGFGIMAYMSKGADYTAANKQTFMDNQHVEWNGSAWTYSPVKYWPGNNTDRLSFFAYAPYVVTGNSDIKLMNETGSDPCMVVTLPDNQNNMKDIVVATEMNKLSGSGTVTFNFRHIMAGVKMIAKPSANLSGNSQVKMYVTGVKLKHASKLMKVSLFNMKTSTWATPTAFLSNTYDLGNGTNGILNFPAGSTDIDVSSSASGVSLFKDSHALYFIPINGTTGSEAGDVQAEVSYKLMTRSSTSTDTWVTSSATRTVELPAGAFKQNSLSTFTFTLGVNEIRVETAVDVFYDMFIKTAQDLVTFRNKVHGDAGETANPSIRGIQVADIDLSTLTTADKDNWDPIENFQGVYNGNGYKISNLKISGEQGGPVGLFYYTSPNSILTGIKLVNATVTSTHGNTGTLAGSVEGVVSHCEATGTVSALIRGLSTGGLIGHVRPKGQVTLCEANVTVNVNIAGREVYTRSNVGGLVGYNQGTIASCATKGAIKTNAWNLNVGGCVGLNDGNIFGSFSRGDVNADENRPNIGGFVGFTNSTSLIAGCYSIGNVTIKSDLYDCTFAGSFAGGYGAEGTYINCYTYGDASSPHEYGGFFCTSPKATYQGCYTRQSYVGHNIKEYPGIDPRATTNAAMYTVRKKNYTSTVPVTITAGHILSVAAVKELPWTSTDFWNEKPGTDGWMPEINWEVVP